MSDVGLPGVRYCMPIKRGNMKIGKDTLIFNMNSATDCPARAKGLCKLGNKCYALKIERYNPNALPYKRRQEGFWDNHSAEDIYDDIKYILHRERLKTRYVRFSESGDFKTQADVEKMKELARFLFEHRIVLYGYTARIDLDFSHLPDNLVVTGSSFMIDNKFTAVKEVTLGKGENVCPMDCSTCILCKTKGKYTVKCRIH